MTNDSSLQATCCVCKKPIGLRPENEDFPFCSSHCQHIDLGRWLNEGYRLSVDANETDRRVLDELSVTPPEEDA